MAARKSTAKKAAPRKPAGASSRGGSAVIGGLLGWIKLAAVLAVGLAAGYAWRSYYPLALPFESRLVADATSSDLGNTVELEEATARAKKAERLVKELSARVEELEEEQRETERELGDLAIKNMLGQ